MSPSTLAGALLDPMLAADPVGPRITYYDDASGERIELSAVTLANWAAKTANLLRDELGATPGDGVAVLLPAHWQTAAVLLGVWWIGCETVLAGDAELAVCTRDRLDEADGYVGGGEIAVASLDPFGRAVDDLPVGLTDFATAVRAHGDQIVPERSPGPALDGAAADEVYAAAQNAAATLGLTRGQRVLSTRSWDTGEQLVNHLLSVFAVGGSLVQVANADPEKLPRRIETERVSRVL